MNRQDTFEHIASYLNDSSLACLSSSSRGLNLASSKAYGSNHFWMLRVMHLMHKTDIPLDGDYRGMYYSLSRTLPVLDSMLNRTIKYQRPGHMRQLTYMQAWLLPTASELLLQHEKITEASIEQVNSLFLLLTHIGATDPLKLLVSDARVTSDTLGNSFKNACDIGSVEIASIILHAGRFNITSDEAVLLFLDLCKADELDMIWFFLDDERLSTHAYTNEVFASLCENGITEVASLFLVDERIDPGTLTLECLQRVRKRGHSEVLSMLFEDGRMSFDSYEDEHRSVSGVVARYLSNPNLDPRRKYDRIFIDACYEGDWDLIECLLSGHEISEHLIGRGMIATGETGQQERLVELISHLIK